jgi:hypothetical protein
VSKEKKMGNVADMNFYRSEYLSMLGLSFAIQECKTLWQGLESERSARSEGELQGKGQSDALRLDFTMTYYQLNQFLIDNFHDS